MKVLIENTITIPEGSSEVTLQVPTIEDEIIEPDGRITVELVDTDDYNLSNSDDSQSASVSVINNLPVISIVATSTSPIEEGADAQYRITSSLRTLLPFVVNFEVSEGDPGDILKDSVPSSITIPANNAEVTLNIETDDDDIVEVSDEIVVRLLPSTNYTLASDDSLQSATISINDNEVIPIVTIEPNTESVIEGGIADFYITTTPAVNREFEVKFQYLGRSGEFIVGDSITSTKFVTTQTERLLRVITEDDEVAETDGEIIVSILEDINYTLNEDVSKQSASVPVSNNDIPVISVSSGGDINEGETATFSISSDIVLSNTWVLDVRYELSGGDNFIASDQSKVGGVEFGPIAA